MIGPWILFAPESAADLGDLQFIQDRVNAGEWLEAHGAINAVANEISIIPASGKTFYAFKGKIIISTHVIAPLMLSGSFLQNTSDRVKAAYKVNGVIKDTTNIGIFQSWSGSTANQTDSSGGYGNGDLGDGKFDVLGLFLVGDGVKDVTIENILDAGSADATMSGWIKTT